MDPARKRPEPEAVPEPEATNSQMLRLVEKREHSLLSLIELSKELTVSLDFYGIADLALFNLMGQLCTAKAALWIVPSDDSRPVVLLRSHGIRKQWARAIGASCGPRLAKGLREGEPPRLARDLEDVLDPAGLRLSEEAEIALYVPIHARGKLFALIGLGHRVDGKEFEPVELQVLQASLGMIGVALENTGLYNRLLEKHRQLRSANENLKELDRLKSEFLRNVNHELRTPLTIIIAYTNYLIDLESDAPDSQRAEFLDTIAGESGKLKQLLEKLLDFSSMSENDLDIQTELGNICDTLSTFYQDRLPGVTESLHEFSYSPGEDSITARYDPQRLRQVMDVLVDNAVKFTPQGARIELKVSRSDSGSKCFAIVELSDGGPGIDPERLPHVFDSFRQGDGSMTREVGGLGMGLAFAKKLVDQMGGRIEVESEAGKGTLFRILLPCN